MARPHLAPVLGVVALAAVTALTGCGGPTATAAPPTPVPSGLVFVEAREYKFTPSTLIVPAGSVTFSVRNAGMEKHDFELFDASVAVGDGIKGLATGATAPLTVTLPAGSYVFKCVLNGHDQLGMTGTLTVQ